LIAFKSSCQTIDETNQKDHPSLAKTIYIPTIIVLNDNLHSLISQGKEKGILVPFLAIHEGTRQYTPKDWSSPQSRQNLSRNER